MPLTLPYGTLPTLLEFSMMKLFAFILFALVYNGLCDEHKETDTDMVPNKNERHKRLLFYDEEGNLVKTYSNSLQAFSKNDEPIPFIGNFWKPFYLNNYVRPSITPSAHMIPISSNVIEQIISDPLYQNKLVFPKHNMVIEPNPLCLGKRVPITSQKSCNTFLNCWDGWASEQECPKGLLFSEKGYCDYYDKVDCSSRKLKDSSTMCSSDFETFPNVRNCNEFFVCVTRVPIRFKCPADLAYSPHLGICDYAYRVDCRVPAQGSAVMSDESLRDLIPTSSPLPTDLDKSLTGGSTDLKPPSGGFEVKPPENVAEIKPHSGVVELKSPVTKTSTSIDSWTTTHVAMSRQDAIRQLKLGRIAKLSSV